jgi:hypothetical protein
MQQNIGKIKREWIHLQNKLLALEHAQSLSLIYYDTRTCRLACLLLIKTHKQAISRMALT